MLPLKPLKTVFFFCILLTLLIPVQLNAHRVYPVLPASKNASIKLKKRFKKNQKFKLKFKKNSGSKTQYEKSKGRTFAWLFIIGMGVGLLVYPIYIVLANILLLNIGPVIASFFFLAAILAVLSGGIGTSVWKMVDHKAGRTPDKFITVVSALFLGVLVLLTLGSLGAVFGG